MSCRDRHHRQATTDAASRRCREQSVVAVASSLMALMVVCAGFLAAKAVLPALSHPSVSVRSLNFATVLFATATLLMLQTAREH